MVQLYGVTHGGSIDSIYSSSELRVDPSRELLDDLAELPKGSLIGVEWFEGDTWQQVQEDLINRVFAAGLEEHPFFDHSTSHYWEVLLDNICRLDLQPVFLEDTDVWLCYNQALVDSLKGNQDELFRFKGESESHYYAKLVGHNEAKNRRDLAVRKIHEIERDSALLSHLASGNLHAAVVGIAHADYWIAHKERIQQRSGVIFDSYAKQEPSKSGYPPIVFVRNAHPNQNILFERESLERAIRLMDYGRVVDGTPDYVGTWSLYEPSKGYFEMFIRLRNGERVEGVIEDILGTAIFTGVLNASGIQFTKKYVAASADAIKEQIPYEAKRVGNEFCGVFIIPGMRGPFYLIEAN